MEDIPEALRDKSHSPKVLAVSPTFIIGGLLITLAGVVGVTTAFLASPKIENTVNVQPSVTPTPTTPSPSPTPTPTPTPTPPDNILGHLSYEQAPLSDLKAISPDGRVKLRSAAAAKFQQMQADARAQGINLVAISGFRSINDQEHLFFEVKEERSQITTKRAEVSAPPGYSEHHTGYAIDIGDGTAPATHLNANFEQTAAFRWLQENAPKYSFELSFPPDNPQGISYEPWHWRFVGNSHSLETFYKARNISQPIN
jgi:D-alanyl-D-alanine carboxypeptidase